jgi:hypothetical protein
MTLPGMDAREYCLPRRGEGERGRVGLPLSLSQPRRTPVAGQLEPLHLPSWTYPHEQCSRGRQRAAEAVRLLMPRVVMHCYNDRRG